MSHTGIAVATEELERACEVYAEWEGRGRQNDWESQAVYVACDMLTSIRIALGALREVETMRPKDPEDMACEDCGNDPCDCAARCSGCGKRLADLPDEPGEYLCGECDHDKAEAQREDADLARWEMHRDDPTY